MTSPKTEQLEQQVEQTREELAGAVEELAARTDVKERLKTRARTLAASARRASAQPRVQAGAGILTGAVAIVGVLVRRRQS